MSAGEATGRERRILVIDDDDIARQAVSDLLEAGSFSVFALASPIGATQVIATQGIVAAVIDLNMPVMSGDRFIALMRTWDRIRDLPVVLISGESSETVREAIAQLPGVALVTKAQMNDLLVTTLSYALMRRPITAPGRTPVRSDHPAGKAAPSQGQACLGAWREFVTGSHLTASKLLDKLASMRAEAQAQVLTNIAQLLVTTSEIVQLCGSMRPIPVEVDGAVTELLTQLAGVEPDKERTLDRSLALTIHRSRLDRARQLLR